MVAGSLFWNLWSNSVFKLQLCVTNSMSSLLFLTSGIVIVLVIITSKFLKCYSHAEHRAPVLCRIRGVVKRLLSSGGVSPVARETTQREELEQISAKSTTLGDIQGSGWMDWFHF